MKNTILLFLLVIIANITQAKPPITSQMSAVGAVCDNSQWDWESDDPKNWFAYVSQQNGVATSLSNPFKTNTSGTKISDIGNNGDYKKVDGWVLVKRDFGCYNAVSSPYFILYNKYTSTLRIFVNDVGSEYGVSNYQNIVFYLQGNSTSGKLTGVTSSNNGQLGILAPDQYLNNTYNGNDLIVYTTPNDVSGGWKLGEFQLLFDPNIASASYIGSTFTIKMVGVSDQKLTANIFGISRTADMAFYGNTSDVISSGVDANGGAYQRFEAGAKKGLAILSSPDEARANINKATEDIFKLYPDQKTNPSNVFKAISKVNQITDTKSSFSKALGLVAGAVGMASPVLNFVGGIVGLFSGSDETPMYIRPSFTSYDLQVSGYIKTTMPRFTVDVKIPGAGILNSNHPINPYFDCPLGIFNLNNSPQFKCITYDRIDKVMNGTTLFKSQYKSYKMTNDLSYSAYKSIGLEVVSVKACLIAQLSGETFEKSYLYYDATSSHNRYDYLNHILSDVDADRVKVLYYDPSGNNNHVVGTPLVDINCLKNTTLTVKSNAKVAVRVVAILKKTGANESSVPIYFVKDYAPVVTELSGSSAENPNYSYPIYALPPFTDRTTQYTTTVENVSSTTTSVYPASFTPSYSLNVLQNANLIPIQSGLINEAVNELVVQNVTINKPNCYPNNYGQSCTPTKNPFIYRAGGKVTLLPNFKTTAGAILKVTCDYGYKMPSCGTLLFTESNFTNCYNSNAWRLDLEQDDLESESNTSFVISPNPSSGIFNVRLPDNENY